MSANLDLDLLGPDGKLMKVPKLPVMQKSNKNTVILNLATKSSYKQNHMAAAGPTTDSNNVVSSNSNSKLMM